MLFAADRETQGLAFVLTVVAQSLIEAARHILPHEHSQLVAVIVVAGWLDFDVLAQHVEACLAQPADFPLHGFIGGWRVQAVRPPSLIQRTMLEDRPAVQQDDRLVCHRSRTNRDLAHAEVAGHRIQRRALDFSFGIQLTLGLPEARRALVGVGGLRVAHAHQFSLHIVEKRIVWRPKAGVVDGHDRFAVHAHQGSGHRASRGRNC